MMFAKKCSLDLSLFPEDRKICADALLDIWVYAQKLQWHDAFSILSDLASRNLLNLTSSTTRSRVAISHGNASELYFSEHNVMRELALYLACQQNHTAFYVQLLSIHTGTMEKNH